MFVPKGNPMKAGSWEEEPPGRREAATTRHYTKGRQEEMSNFSLFSPPVSCHCLMGKPEQEGSWVMQSARVGPQGTKKGRKSMDRTSRGQGIIRCTMSLSKLDKLSH